MSCIRLEFQLRSACSWLPSYSQLESDSAALLLLHAADAADAARRGAGLLLLTELLLLMLLLLRSALSTARLAELLAAMAGTRHARCSSSCASGCTSTRGSGAATPCM